ncbi:MAG: thiamine diphosphokinase [Acidimicrobiaceae bacterium]|nr:thiamine diphosphokinase [Acidimicrobiaceae bacterium]
MVGPGGGAAIVTGPHHALVVTGGPYPDHVLSAMADGLPPADLMVAADGGAAVARRLRLDVDMVVGDLDSADDRAVAAAGEVRRHPIDKDDTDLELALAAVVEAGCRSATVLATMSGRVDHALGNLLVVAGDRWADLTIDLRVDGAHGRVVRDTYQVDGAEGDLFSLLAIGGPATGVTTTGLIWPLDDATLEPGLGRGLSNRLVAQRAEVQVASGVLLALHQVQDRPVSGTGAG